MYVMPRTHETLIFTPNPTLNLGTTMLREMNTYLPVTWSQDEQAHSTLAKQEANHYSFPQWELGGWGQGEEIAGMSVVEGAQDRSNCQKQLAYCAAENS